LLKGEHYTAKKQQMAFEKTTKLLLFEKRVFQTGLFFKERLKLLMCA